MRPERWLWQSRTGPARLVRAALRLPSAVYGVAVRARVHAYGAGLMRTHRIERPVVAVGNLSVGGTGKTPLAAWIASVCAARGVKPAVVLRGYGGDEGSVHRQLTPAALVIEDPDRVRAARRAIRDGAEIIVLDDAFQRLDIHRDFNIAVIAAESLDAPQHLLPAGPWREGWPALRRADGAVITRKRATRAAAELGARRVAATLGTSRVAIACLEISGLAGLRSRTPVPRDAIAGRRVLASCGIGDPESFAFQLRHLGAEVTLRTWRNHHAYRPADIRAVLSAGRWFDYVVVTAKDAVKLRRLWPAGRPEPLVAELMVKWEVGGDWMDSAIRCLTATTYGNVQRWLGE